MAITDITVGTVANDGTGQTLRAAFQRVNSNYDEFYITDTIFGKLSNITPAKDTPTLTEIIAVIGLPSINNGGAIYFLKDLTNSCIWLAVSDTNIWCIVKLNPATDDV